MVRRVVTRPTAHGRGGGDAWLGGEVEGGVVKQGGTRGAEGEATGDDHKVAAPSGAAMAMVVMPQGMP